MRYSFDTFLIPEVTEKYQKSIRKVSERYQKLPNFSIRTGSIMLTDKIRIREFGLLFLSGFSKVIPYPEHTNEYKFLPIGNQRLTKIQRLIFLTDADRRVFCPINGIEDHFNYQLISCKIFFLSPGLKSGVLTYTEPNGSVRSE